MQNLIPFLAGNVARQAGKTPWSVGASSNKQYQDDIDVDQCERMGSYRKDSNLHQNDAVFISLNLPITKNIYGEATSLMKELVKNYAITTTGVNTAYLAVKLLEEPSQFYTTDEDGDARYCGPVHYTLMAIDDPKQRTFQAQNIDVVDTNSMYSICQGMHKENCEKVKRIHPMYRRW